METDNVRVVLRKAKNLGMDDEDWMDVIKMLEEKEKEAKKWFIMNYPLHN